MTFEPTMLPVRVFLQGDPSHNVARPALGLTLYLADHAHWAHGGAASVFGRFVDLVGPSLCWFSTSTHPSARRFDSDILGSLAEHLAVQGLTTRVRHLFEFRVADDPNAASASFTYREVDPAQSTRAASLSLTFPHDFSTDDVLQLAIEIAHEHPFHSGIAGWTVSYSRRAEREAFSHAHLQCKRFLGLDVQYPDAMAWYATTGLPGVGWLTMIGDPLLERLALAPATLTGREWSSDVGVMRLRKGVLVRAGDKPMLGDLNRVELVPALHEVAALLGPHLVAEPPPLPGTFGIEDTTARWFRRFVDPSEWA
jgi:hypothetical protein